MASENPLLFFGSLLMAVGHAGTGVGVSGTVDGVADGGGPMPPDGLAVIGEDLG